MTSRRDTTVQERVATLYTMATIYDVGNQFLAHSGAAMERWAQQELSRLPRTYDEYVRRLYPVTGRDWFLNYGLLAAIVAFVVTVAGAIS